jgi:hypothetical protein
MHTQFWQMRLVVSLLVVLSGILGLPRHSPAHAEFTCAAGDVACLIDAINQANSNDVANTITLEAGTYTLTEVNNDADGPNGLPSVTGVVTIQGAGADATILERDAGAPDFRLVHVAATGVLTLDALTVRGGRLILSRPGEGAGLFNRGTLSLSRTTCADNVAFASGCLTNRGTVTIARTTFVNNSGTFRAGGVSNEGGTLFIADTTFASNISQGPGGLRNQGGTVVLTNSALMDNQGDISGGIFNADGAVVLTNSTIAQNFSRFGNGALANSNGTAILTNTTVADNRARSPSGGLSNAGGQLMVLNTIVARNTTTAPPQVSNCIGQVISLGTNLIGDPTGCTIILQPTDLTGPNPTLLL